MSSSGELLDCLGPKQHVLQLYGADDLLLIQNVGRFLSEGLKRHNIELRTYPQDLDS